MVKLAHCLALCAVFWSGISRSAFSDRLTVLSVTHRCCLLNESYNGCVVFSVLARHHNHDWNRSGVCNSGSGVGIRTKMRSFGQSTVVFPFAALHSDRLMDPRLPSIGSFLCVYVKKESNGSDANSRVYTHAFSLERFFFFFLNQDRLPIKLYRELIICSIIVYIGGHDLTMWVWLVLNLRTFPHTRVLTFRLSDILPSPRSWRRPLVSPATVYVWNGPVDECVFSILFILCLLFSTVNIPRHSSLLNNDMSKLCSGFNSLCSRPPLTSKLYKYIYIIYT